MKNIIRFIFFSFFIIIHIVHGRGDPLLVVSIMVKNEEHVIEKTLMPFLSAGVNAFVVFDTGSTDNTVACVKKWYKKHPHIRGYIVQEEFVDFATSRNRALDLVDIYFPQATFTLMLDAEWYMHNVEDLCNVCQQEQYNENISAYLVRLVASHNAWYQGRLMRCASHVRFVGPVHEVPDRIVTEKIPPSIFFSIEPTRLGHAKTRQRWLRDCEVLLKEHEKNSYDPRTVFYLGQTYDCLEQYEHAYYWYQKRVHMRGWNQETFVALYRLGMVTEHLMDLDPEKYTWQDALSWYLAAYQFRPSRAEPLYKIASYYWQQKQYALCYFFAKQACEISYPIHDWLFIDGDMYYWERYDLLGCCAWYVQEYEVGKNAILKALEVKCTHSRLLKNLEWYESAM
ncbi:MAG TPA: hypothetical protein VEK38_02900 [Candidatus Bathyarchaeia archaeon]|nr:hypothetical protein [Candidatus Bathyarchaeia archaeon]